MFLLLISESTHGECGLFQSQRTVIRTPEPTSTTSAGDSWLQLTSTDLQENLRDILNITVTSSVFGKKISIA